MRQCPVCDSKESRSLHTQNFTIPDGAMLPAVYDVVYCIDCGMCFADTDYTQESYDSYYASYSRYVDPGATELKHDVERFKELAQYLSQFVKKTDRILDVGCARGGLVDALENIGYTNVHGIDPIIGTTLSEDTKKYDLVTLTHVLEHVLDVDGMMRMLYSHVERNGLLYIETPDASKYADNFIVPYYYFDSEHINHFDKHSLVALAERYGFHVSFVIAKNSIHSGVSYPCVGLLCRTKRPLFHQDTISSISKYVQMSEEKLAPISGEFAVWGAGSYAQRLFATGYLDGAVKLVDRNSNKQGTTLNNHIVEDPSVLVGTGLPVFICSALRHDEILNDIKKMGLTEIS